MKNMNQNLIQTVSCSVLCGGSSSRMGVDKMCVLLAGRHLLEHVLDKTRSLFSEVMISVRKDAQCSKKDLPVVRDLLTADSPLAGIHASLKYAKGKPVVIIAVDMPIVRPALLRLLARESINSDVVVPKVRGYFEPLLAAYSPDCILPIEKKLAQGNRRVVGFYNDVRIKVLNEEQVRKVDPELVSFSNINSKEDLIEVERIIKIENRLDEFRE